MTLKVDGDKDFFGRMRSELAKEIRTALTDSTATIQATVRSELRQKRLIDQGMLWKSIQASVTWELGTTRGLGIVGSNAIHVLPLELGIKKRFFPPETMIARLEGWVRRKGIATGRDIQRAARAIAWKIARKGLDPRRFPAYFFRDAHEKSAPLVAQIFARHLARASTLSKGKGGRLE